MKVQKVIALSLAIIMAVSLTACSSGNKGENLQSTEAAEENGKQTETAGTVAAETAETAASAQVMGNHVTYDPSQEVNNGEPIELEWWMWGGDDLFGKFVEQYEGIHPNVKINIVVNPWNDYWTKLPLALKGKDGPALFNIHNSYHENIISNCAPYDISKEDLAADYTGTAAHEIDGKIYYIDYGMMTGAFYYNKDMWAEAGLTESDIPKTWDELAQVAEKLTKKEGTTIKQAGFNMNGGFHTMLLGLHYQYGDNLLEDDGKTPRLNSDTMKKNTQMLLDFYDKSGVGSKDFGTDAGQSFGEKQTAICYNWGFFYNMMLGSYPDVDFGTFEIPTPDGQVPYAYDRYNGESTIGINANASKEALAIAQDFNRFFLANKELQKELCLANSVFPANVELQDDADILANPALGVVAADIERYIWPGALPATFENTLKKSMEDILYNGVSVSDALDLAQETVVNDLKQSDFTGVEAMYKFASEK